MRNAQRKWTIQSALDHLGAAIGVMAIGHGEAAVKMAMAAVSAEKSAVAAPFVDQGVLLKSRSSSTNPQGFDRSRHKARRYAQDHR